jgi:hypothetical protein
MEVINEKNWFQRNWMWAVPVGGCGCGCLGLILVFVFGIGAAFFGVSTILDNVSDAFDNAEPVYYAKEKAFNHPKVIQLLGDNLETYGIPSGKISLSNNDGNVDFSIPITGSLGEATIIVKGIKADGVWAYEDLYVIIKETQEQINLLEKAIETY